MAGNTDASSKEKVGTTAYVTKNYWTDFVFHFALQTTMKGVHIPLSILMHAIVNRFKMRNKKTSIQNALPSKLFMLGKDATLALKTEPWTVDTVSSLPMVHSYQKVTFGDGAKLKSDTGVKTDASSNDKVCSTACVT